MPSVSWDSVTIPVVDTVTAERETVQFKLEGMHHSRRRVGGWRMGLIVNKRHNITGDVPFKGGGWRGLGHDVIIIKVNGDRQFKVGLRGGLDVNLKSKKWWFIQGEGSLEHQWIIKRYQHTCGGGRDGGDWTLTLQTVMVHSGEEGLEHQWIIKSIYLTVKV